MIYGLVTRGNSGDHCKPPSVIFVERDYVFAISAVIACLSVRPSVCHKPKLYQNYRVPGLSCSVVCVILFVTVFEKIVEITSHVRFPIHGGEMQVGSKSCVLQPVLKSPAQTPYSRKFVHPPQWSASTTVRWRENTRCHQHFKL